jgi:hypothetical protein
MTSVCLAKTKHILHGCAKGFIGYTVDSDICFCKSANGVPIWQTEGTGKNLASP